MFNMHYSLFNISLCNVYIQLFLVFVSFCIIMLSLCNVYIKVCQIYIPSETVFYYMSFSVTCLLSLYVFIHYMSFSLFNMQHALCYVPLWHTSTAVACAPILVGRCYGKLQLYLVRNECIMTQGKYNPMQMPYKGMVY